MRKLSVIIPAYNEAKTLCTVLDKVKDVPLASNVEKEVILVDDCSDDDTEDIVKNYIKITPELDVIYIKHEINKGKGAALHTGIKYATGDFLIIQDADLEYDPNDYNILLKPILEGFADVVYGSRFIGGKPHRTLYFWHYIGNKILTFVSNVFSKLNLTDMETGYKLFKIEIIQSLNLCEQRFGFEPEVTAKISRIPQIRIYEVGISYYGRTYEEGKKIRWKDGIWALYCIIKYGFFKN